MKVKKFAQYVKDSKKPEATSDEIMKKVKSSLVDLGYLETGPSNPDQSEIDLYDDIVRSAILAYQADNGIKCDGKITDELIQSLSEKK